MCRHATLSFFPAFNSLRKCRHGAQALRKSNSSDAVILRLPDGGVPWAAPTFCCSPSCCGPGKPAGGSPPPRRPSGGAPAGLVASAAAIAAAATLDAAGWLVGGHLDWRGGGGVYCSLAWAAQRKMLWKIRTHVSAHDRRHHVSMYGICIYVNMHEA